MSSRSARASAQDESLNRLDAPHGILLDRSQVVRFRFEGREVSGYVGDTIASALAAHGQFLISRSFKYHRARGALTMAGQDSHTIVQVPGNPNALADRHLITDGLEVSPVNVYGSLKKDKGRWLGMLSRFLPVGFYYKAFYRPKGAWEIWARWFRRMAGLGVIDPDHSAERHDKQYLFCDVAVVGGGAAGMAAALEVADAGLEVLLVDEHTRLGGALNYERENRGSEPLSQVHERLVRSVTDSPHISVMTDAVCNGWFSDNWLPVIRGNTLYKVRARQLVLATGVLEQPAIFRNNDLPGIMMGSAAQRLIRLYGVRPGKRAVVLTGNCDGYATALDLLDADVDVRAVVDTRVSPTETELVRSVRQRGVAVRAGSVIYAARGNRSDTHVAGVEIRSVDSHGTVEGESENVDVDLVCMSVGFMPTFQLACQAGATLHYDDSNAVFTITGLSEAVHIAGAVNGVWGIQAAIDDGRRAAQKVIATLCETPDAVLTTTPVAGTTPSPNSPWPIVSHPRGREFVDTDEDLQIEDLVNATRDGYVDMQLVKRYSTCGMGPSQGRQSALAAARIISRVTGKSVAETGVTTARPPFAAERLAHSAGRRFFPRRLTSMHACHVRAGATMMQAGLWDRPAFYGAEYERDNAIRREVNAVRTGVGMIDVSTLGGLEVRGSDAAEFMNRLYTWGFARQPVGRARYALMTDQSGVIIDDGVACRISAHHYYVTATTGGVERVYRSMLKWNAQWRLDVDVANVTGAWCAVNLAGPQAREVLSRVCHDVKLSHQDFGYMEVRRGTVAQIPVRLLRVGFVGETGYEIHAPQSCGEALWNALLDAGKTSGIVPFGVEAQRVLRLEKGHIIVGQDTDAMSTPDEVQMSWAVSDKKSFFVGNRTIRELRRRGIPRKLVGYRLPPDEHHVPLENQLVLDGENMIGRVTSCVHSPTLGYAIGLAYVPSDYDQPELCIKTSGDRKVVAEICPTPFYDPENERQLV